MMRNAGKFPHGCPGEMQLEGIGLETAAKCWLSYTETVAFIDPVFNEFDTDGTGNLSREKLSQVLSRLNDDLEPSADDLDFVMSKADVIGDGLIHKPEMVQAISIWYSIEDEDKVSYQHHHRRHGDREQEEQVCPPFPNWFRIRTCVACPCWSGAGGED
jgi:Ca2+-binding EF-hand superfamily protein